MAFVEELPAGASNNGKSFPCSKVVSLVEKNPKKCASASRVFSPHCCVKCSICRGGKPLLNMQDAGTMGGVSYTCIAAQLWLDSPEAKKARMGCGKARRSWAKRCCR
eukprot:UN0705